MRNTRGVGLAVAVVAVAMLVAWLAPGPRAWITAAATVTDGVDLPTWRPFAPAVTVRTVTIADTPADVYTSRAGAPVIVLVPGAAPAGREDRRVRDLAELLARADRQVVVPELAVYGEDLVVDDIELLVDTVLHLSADGRPVVLVGISFGGSLALVAAAHPAVDGRVAGVATFGAYADLVGVLQAAVTGVSLVGDQEVPWAADPRAEEVVRDHLIGLLLPDEAPLVRTALDTGDVPADMPPSARAVVDLLTHDDPRRTDDLAASLSPDVRARLDGVSPVVVADRLTHVPIVAMHARDDPVIPYGEALRLGAAVPTAHILTVEGLEHAELQLARPGGWLRALDDLRTMWSFTSRLVRWQEPTWPWQPG